MQAIRLLVFVAVAWQEIILIGAQASTKTGFRTNSGPSSNAIAVTAPNLAGGRKAVDATPGPFLRDFQPPFPTNAWWSGFTVSKQDSVAAGPFPFQSVTRNTGLEFGISDNRRFDGTSIHQATQFDWRFSFQELPDNINNRKAISWDTQTVCLRYMGSSATMDSCLVPGSPYMTVSFSNATVLAVSVKGNAGFTWITQGKKAKLTNDGGTYILYVLSGTLNLLKQSDSIITSATTFTGTLRMAKVKETSQESILDSYSVTYPTGLDMTYTVNGNVSQQVWTWRTVGDSAKLLIMSWPHHRKSLQSPKYANIQYLTLKGYMKGVTGNRWVLKHDLPTMTWFAQNSPQGSCLSELNKTLDAEVNDLTVVVPGDFYFWGGSFGRAAQLATIAEHIGRMDLVPKVVAILKQSVEYWFDANHRPAPAFETGWGGFINGDGWNNTWVDFGNGYYNDHHFHYGYLLHGAAVIGKYDKAWMDRNNEFFTQVARDIGNPSPSDPHYTVTRHMDWFAGHSWASGIANGAGSRDQESTTEAINGYYGLLLFATVTNNQALIDYSRMLIAIEVAGAQTYWHLYPSVNDSSTPYPEQGFRDLVTVGNVMDAQAGAWLFWGAQKIQIAAIQILPLTPIGQYTYDQGWMEKVVPYCQKELDDPNLGDDFKSVIWAAYSKVNPQLAANKSANLSNWGSGNSASNQLYFLSTQPSATNICSTSSQTPEDSYRIQDVNSGKYITLANGNQLAATATADVLGTTFKLEFIPGGGTIQATSNNQYVTASPDASSPLSAARDKAQGYEKFRWARQSDDTYVLTAMVNKLTVSTTTTDARLINNGDVSKLRLIPATNNSATTVPSQGVLRNSQSGQFVVSTSAKPVLMANSASTTGATVWSFERIAGTSDSAAKYAIKSKVTNQYVTANADGSSPLEAARNSAQGWEYFQLVPYQNGYLIVHDVNGYPVTVRSDSALVDDASNTAVNSSYVWNIQ